MAKKVLSVRVEEEILKRLETDSRDTKKTQAEFIAEAIEYYSRYLRILSTGGDMVGVQNPQLIEHTEEQARTAVEILSDAAARLTQNHPGIDFGIHYIADYAAVRLFKDTEGQRNRFLAGADEVMADITRESIINQNTKRALRNN